MTYCAANCLVEGAKVILNLFIFYVCCWCCEGVDCKSVINLRLTVMLVAGYQKLNGEYV